MKKSCILAIDQGTSGSKAILFDQCGRILAKATTPLKSIYPQPGFVEQDPQEIFNGVIDAAKSCVNEFVAAGGDPGAIATCGISNQRETFVLWDRDGNPLHNAVVWQCKRPVGICGRLKDTETEREIHHRTGLIVDPYFSGTKAVWLNENDDRVKHAVEKGEACFGTIDTWLLYKLTRGKVYKTDYTNACRTLFFNIDTLSWDQTLLETFGLKRLLLPEPQPSSSHFGGSDFDGVLPHAIPIGGMIGDSHASAFGQACFQPGSAKVTMGTGSSILMNTGGERKRSGTGMVETICWSIDNRVDYALEGIIVSCGSTLTWLQNQLGLFGNVSELEPAARSVDSSDGVYLVPAFAGMGAPHWKMDARAMLIGLSFGSTKNHVLRAALESIPYQIKDVIAAMEHDSGIKLRQLVADGGITKNRFVMQMLADLLEASIVQRGIEDVSALGAACMAGLHHGIYPSLESLDKLESDPVAYAPRENRSAVSDGYAGWRNALRTL